MASVDGEYVGPLEPDDAARIMQDLRAGRPVLADKQIRYRRCVDPGAGGDHGTDRGATSSDVPPHHERDDT
jgi:hypothetical protein